MGRPLGRIREQLVATSLATCVLLGGCGGGSPGVDVAGPNVGEPISLADCTDWKSASTEQRLGTIGELRDFAGGPAGSAPGHGAVLDDDKTYDLLENACSQEYARAFKLYKLYERAASFTGH